MFHLCTYKHCTILEKLAKDKHSSLIQKFITYANKTFYNIGSRVPYYRRDPKYLTLHGTVKAPQQELASSEALWRPTLTLPGQVEQRARGASIFYTYQRAHNKLECLFLAGVSSLV